MYEHNRQPLLPRRAFASRVGRSVAAFALLLSASLGAGTVGYHVLADLDWVDAVLNAAMILTGMGPVSPLHSPAAKLFAAGYALFSGIVFVAGVSLVMAPIVHRFLHRFHLGAADTERPRKDRG